jgi:hypothetical protein
MQECTMWIPTPIYEALPYFYVGAGILFFSGTTYIGLSAPGAFLYLGTGVYSIAWGAMIFAKRSAYRQRSSTGVPPEPA